MNYSKKFNTTKKAIAEIKRLENECARLANGKKAIETSKLIRDLKRQLSICNKKREYMLETIESLDEKVQDTAYTLGKNEIARLQASIVQLKDDIQCQKDMRIYETSNLNFEIAELKKDNKHEDNSIQDLRLRNVKLQASIVQFRKTQDYQSGKIGELLEEVKNEVIKRRMCDVDLKNSRSVNEGYKEVLKKRDKTINMLQVDMGFMSRAFMEQGVMFHTGRELTSGYDEKCDGGYKSTMTDLKAGV